jgi:indolepyruvate ferredoxin oxidoreductase
MTVEILNGNELIIQGGLEAGFDLYTGYPGSPLADYFNILYRDREALKEKGIKVVIANSEANAAAMASGAKMAGRNCLVAMKSMGLHVAADALSVGNFANPINNGEESSGIVVVVGDDPWSISTSTPADSRYLYKHLHIPFLEPSTPQELKDWMKVALELSRKTSVYQGILLTTFMAEGGGRVEVYPEKKIDENKKTFDTNSFDLSKNVMVPPNSLKADTSMINDRFPRVIQELELLNLDKTFGKKDSKVGVISSGVVFETVKHVFEENHYLEHFSLYKLACSYPLVENSLAPYLRGIDQLIVVEEKRGFLESELRSLCSKLEINIKINGKHINESTKEIGFPAFGGLSYEIVSDVLMKFWKELNIDLLSKESATFCKLDNPMPLRLPTFCPGCPHRETLSLLKDLRSKLDKEGIDLVSHGDVGCYSLAFLPPFKEMHDLSAMGQGGSLGAGMDIFANNPSVVLMGDSTFFHSGMGSISNSVQMNHNITYILLDNDNTAMTGHQMSPSSGVNVTGYKPPRQDMYDVAKSLGVDEVHKVNPSDRYFYSTLLFDIVKSKGTKIIISDKECGLTFHGRQKAEERKVFKENKTIAKKEFYQINMAACEDCRECVDSTGCPGLTQFEDGYGSKIQIDPQICVADSYCTKIKVCPSFELVEVLDYHPTLHKKVNGIDIQKFEEQLSEVTPLKSFKSIKEGESWRVVVTGVGGSGVTTISRVLSQAAKKMGGEANLDFKFMDQKGLAQRNGNVTGHLAIFSSDKSYGAVTPLGTADLLLSPDLLDGAGKINFLSKSGLAIFDSEYQKPLTILTDKNILSDDYENSKVKQKVNDKLGERLKTATLKDFSYNLFGKSVYSSSMILGMAYQQRGLPFDISDCKEAMKKSLPSIEFDNNWLAFNIGRYIVSFGEDKFRTEYMSAKEELRTSDLYAESLVDSVFLGGRDHSLVKVYKSSLEKLKGLLPEIIEVNLAQYIHDIYVYDRGLNIDKFLQEISLLKEKYSEKQNLEIAVRILAKTYWVKDEVFVAHLMLSPVQLHSNKLKYSDLGKTYKVTHINRPSFDIFSRKIEFDINPKDWMLGMMRHARFLRKLMPNWHRKERAISLKIQDELLNSAFKSNDVLSSLKGLDNIKGYRDVRYLRAKSM